MFDGVFHSGESETVQFVAQPYVMETAEAERIAVTHVARTAQQATSQYSSDYASHVSGLANAVAMLAKRVPPIAQYLKKIQSGELPRDLPVLREIFALCNLIKAQHPEIVSVKDRDDLLKEYTDSLLVIYLSSLTKACSHVADLVDKVGTSSDRKGSPKRQHYGHF